LTTNNKKIVENFLLEVWNNGDAKAAEKCLASRYTIHHDPGDPWDGQTLDIEGFKDRLRKSRFAFPDQRFTILETIAEDDRVVISWDWTGTHKEDIPGFPASGKVISMTGLTIYYLKEGKITGHWQLVDRLGVFQQLSGKT